MANVDHILALTKKRKSVHVFREIPFDLDVALLASFDSNPINQPEYNTEREEYLKQSARDGIQVLVNKLFNLPTTLTEEGVTATLPTTGPVTILPRSKRLPKPKPLTKWQKFATEKGIAPKPNKDKLVFDEEKQEWVNRWGWKGKNKDEEQAWIREVKASEELDGGGLEKNLPKQARKQRILKNEKQRLKNVERANAELAKQSANSIKPTTKNPTNLVKGSTTLTKKLEVRAAKIAQHAAQSKAQAQEKLQEQAERKQKVEQLLVSTKKSTASLGKFDKQFVNEPKAKGVKRKFAPTEQAAKLERKSHMEIVEQLAKNPTAFKEKVIKKAKKSNGTPRPGDRSGGDKNNTKGTTNGLVNSRKAIRHLTNGVGPTALQSQSHKKSKKRP